MILVIRTWSKTHFETPKYIAQKQERTKNGIPAFFLLCKANKKIAAGNAPAAKNICRTKERRQQNE